MFASDDAPALEAELHRRFVERQVNKINKRKEFFRVSLTELRQAADELGLESSWTLTAEAAQYRETLALEQAMKTDKELKHKWLEEQATFNFDDESLEEADQEMEEVELQVGHGQLLGGQGSRTDRVEQRLALDLHRVVKAVGDRSSCSIATASAANRRSAGRLAAPASSLVGYCPTRPASWA